MRKSTQEKSDRDERERKMVLSRGWRGGNRVPDTVGRRSRLSRHGDDAIGSRGRNWILTFSLISILKMLARDSDEINAELKVEVNLACRERPSLIRLVVEPTNEPTLD